MGMALKADVTAACRRAGIAKPVDLVHLSHQTMGDRGLEREVLDLFLRQAPAYLERFRDAGEAATRKLVAHSLKGAARGIGAWDLADISARAEESGFSDYAELEAEAGRVCSYILSLRGC